MRNKVITTLLLSMIMTAPALAQTEGSTDQSTPPAAEAQKPEPTSPASGDKNSVKKPSKAKKVVKKTKKPKTSSSTPTSTPSSN